MVKFKPAQFHPPIQVVDVDSSTPIKSSPSKTPSPKIPSSKSIVSGSSQPSEKTSKNIIENEYLAWEHFQMAILDEDSRACYDMGLKEFEHSGVHDLFKVRPYSILVLVYLTIFLCLTIPFSFLFYRPCQSLWQRPDRQRNWTRRGFYWRQGFKRWTLIAKNGMDLLWKLRTKSLKTKSWLKS